MKGKILLLFTNEPPSTDAKFFDGRALTYYGRWTYKYEEALRRGARGAIIIHTTPDGQLRLGRGAQFVGRGDAFREAGAGREVAGFRRVGQQGGGRTAGGAGRERLSMNCWLRPTVAISGRSTWDPDPRAHVASKIRDTGDAQRRGDHSGERPQAERRGSDLQRALGPPGRGSAGERRCASTTARSTMRRAARFWWNWRGSGGRCRRSRGGRRCFWR